MAERIILYHELREQCDRLAAENKVLREACEESLKTLSVFIGADRDEVTAERVTRARMLLRAALAACSKKETGNDDTTNG